MGEGNPKGGRLRAQVVWLAAALLLESAALLWFFAHNRQLRAELREARHATTVPAKVSTVIPDTASASFIFRLAEPPLPDTASHPKLVNSSPDWTKIPDDATPRAWKFIIIHHSATAGGSAQAFETYHRSRGMSNGLAYHFVVCNGTHDTDEGEVEIGSRWLKQLAGGHCRQDSVNEQAIGICLVGDFTQRQPNDRQMESLARLVFDLQKRFGITSDNVLGHGHVAGEFSECPGKSFPWESFRAALARVVEADRAEKQAAFSIKPAAPPLRP